MEKSYRLLKHNLHEMKDSKESQFLIWFL